MKEVKLVYESESESDYPCTRISSVSKNYYVRMYIPTMYAILKTTTCPTLVPTVAKPTICLVENGLAGSRKAKVSTITSFAHPKNSQRLGYRIRPNWTGRARGLARTIKLEPRYISKMM
jgi:hypothetical protein